MGGSGAGLPCCSALPERACRAGWHVGMVLADWLIGRLIRSKAALLLGPARPRRQWAEKNAILQPSMMWNRARVVESLRPEAF